MHSQSTILGAALLVSAVFAAPTPQITTTISEPVLGWPDASVQSTQVDLQAGDRIPRWFPWGANPVTWKGQYDGECSIFRRWRGECTLDRPRWYRNWWDNNNDWDNDNNYYKRSVETTEEAAEPKVVKRDVEASEEPKLQKRQWYPNNYWLWWQWWNAVRNGQIPVGSSTFSGLSSSFSIDNGAPVSPGYYPGWAPPSGWTPPLGYYAPSGWTPPSWAPTPNYAPAVGSATLSGLSSTFNVDK